MAPKANHNHHHHHLDHHHLDQQEQLQSSDSTSTSTSTSSLSSNNKMNDDSDSITVKELQSQLRKLQLEKEEWQRSSSQINARLQELETENESLQQQQQHQQQQQQESPSKNGSNGESSSPFLTLESEEVQLIIDLQEELKAMRQLRDLQNAQIQHLETQQEQDIHANESSTYSSLTASDCDCDCDFDHNNNNHNDDPEQPNSYTIIYWKQKYVQLSERYSKLENDRALGEWNLRNRITEDSLKYHRRLIHYKNKQLQELQSQQHRHQEEMQQLRKQLQASAALVLQHTLRDLSKSQKRIKELEQELEDQQKKLEHAAVTTTPTSPSKSFRGRLPIIQYYKDKHML